MSRAKLQIGELARLLDITPKTVRHYHQLGLLPKPQRADNGYRLYDADSLLRLQRVRRLQAIGLSLQQVKVLLEAKQPAQTMQNFLQSLLVDIVAEQQKLGDRRMQVEALLQEENTLQAVTETTPPSQTFDLVHEKLAPLLENISPALVALDQQVMGQLESFHLLDGQTENWQAAAEYAAAHPVQYQALLAWGEKLMSLSSLPPESPEIEVLAQAFARSEERQFLAQAFQPPPAPNEVSDNMMAVVNETLPLTAAQRRFFELVEQFATP